MTTASARIFVGNSNTLVVENMRNAATAAWMIAGVTVTASLCPINSSDPVSNGGPITLTYLAGSTATWTGTFSKNATVLDGQFYDVVLTVDGGEFLYAPIRLRVKAETRR